MCGRYVIKLLSQIDEYMGVQRGFWQIKGNFRVMPTDTVPVLRSSEGLRDASMMRGGVPFSAHGVPPKLATPDPKRCLKRFRGKSRGQQRGILPAAAFYEPRLNEDGSKQPFYIHLVDREIFGMAGLWERSFKADRTEVLSCTIIMLPDNRLLSEVHNEKLPRCWQERITTFGSQARPLKRSPSCRLTPTN
jgi:putative SOS response-associated peptidase YedK